MKAGVLALQGAFIEHEQSFERLGVACAEIRSTRDLGGIDFLVLPGGESTTQGKLLHETGLFEPLHDMIVSGVPVFATCAGLILLADHIKDDATRHFGTASFTAERNAYGRQLGSFQATFDVGPVQDFKGVFIRAPRIAETGEGVEILAQHDGKIVAARCGNQFAFAFHPELGGDDRVAQWFLSAAGL